jgi:alcohol dehydrogenase (cytochrome c)
MNGAWALAGALALAAVLALGACKPPPAASAGPAPAATPVAATTNLTGATANVAPNDPPGDWRSQARDDANTRYSPLAQITPANVARLKIAWTFSDGAPYGHEGAPLVTGGVMYVVSP